MISIIFELFESYCNYLNDLNDLNVKNDLNSPAKPNGGAQLFKLSQMTLEIILNHLNQSQINCKSF